ncbi:tRNA (adenine(57)-N(1)/adenine(58)-N(1))-methyltransferase TrmI [uncultured archaeon]|nr:tRNA (adenine(57)-N(1)/adenine(58)-N(1))-methyltransferase TrmI [uncultured archaeon]
MLLLMDEREDTYLIKGDSEFHCRFGFIKKEVLAAAKPGDILESNTKHKFRVIQPGMPDYIGKAKRGPQAVLPKDLGIIASYTGIRSGSRVVDAGVGSGILSMYLAHIVAPQKLVAYEVREDFAEIAKSNFKKFGVDNIEVKIKSIYEGIDEEELDLVSLDLPEPWLAVEPAYKALKTSGYLTSYSPSINQNARFMDALQSRFQSYTIETLERRWNMDAVRPSTQMIGHSGFITIARKLY